MASLATEMGTNAKGEKIFKIFLTAHGGGHQNSAYSISETIKQKGKLQSRKRFYVFRRYRNSKYSK